MGHQRLGTREALPSHSASSTRRRRMAHMPKNLRHVLRTVEGHLVSGYADGGDAPDKELQLVPGAVKDAESFLS